METVALCRLRRSHRAQAGFSLLEILVAVGLLAVIIVGLLSMFYQTERAFRVGTRQVDVLETGRAVMELLGRELQEITSVDDYRITNLYAVSYSAPVVQPRPSARPGVPGVPLTNHLQDYYFLVHSNDLWTGIGYFMDTNGHAGVGTIYRYESSWPGTFVDQLTNLFKSYQTALIYAPSNWSRLADNIIHLRIIPYDRNGIVYTNLNLLDYSFPAQIAANVTEMSPAFVDLELGILEPRALERYASITDPVKAADYLVSHVDNVHFFRQRIAVRTRQ